MLTREQALDQAIRLFPLVVTNARFFTEMGLNMCSTQSLFAKWLTTTGRDDAIRREFHHIMEKERG